METFLNRLSATLFYFFGASFFIAYLLHYNELLGLWPRYWMEVFDLPLALVAILFGGTSLHLSIRKPDSKALVSGIIIAIPLIAVFALLFAMNYWEVLGLPAGNA